MRTSLRELALRASLFLRPRLGNERWWDLSAVTFQRRHPDLEHIGDEWTGAKAGAASTIEDYVRIIEDTAVAPYLTPDDTVLEIGVGGGRTAAILLRYARNVIAADISGEMLAATRKRLGDSRVTYVKLDGITLDGVADRSADVCFCFDTLVHVEPRDIFNYLTRIPAKLRGRRLCILHHTNTLSELGWQRFLSDWQRNVAGRRWGTPHSVMSPDIMSRFLSHLGYRVLARDSTTIPRDCIWVCAAPEAVSPDLLVPTSEMYEKQAR